MNPGLVRLEGELLQSMSFVLQEAAKSGGADFAVWAELFNGMQKSLASLKVLKERGQL